MKFDPRKSFGYPVLRPESDDYLRSAFQLDIDFKIDKDDVHQFAISYSFHCGVRELVEFVEKEKASYWIRVSCRSTFYMCMQRVKQSGVLLVRGSDLREIVEISGFVIGEDEALFSSRKINPEFGFESFVVKRGQILAQSIPATYVVEKEIWKHISSIFEYKPSEVLKDGEFSVELDGDSGYVEISANKNQCQRFKELEKSEKGRLILVNSLFFPVVVQMITAVQDRRETVVDKKWAKVMLAQAAARNIAIESAEAFVSAQRLLDRPFSRLANSFLDEQV